MKQPIRRGPFTVLDSKPVYSNPWIRVREDSVVRPGGSRGIFGVVEMVTGASILALNDQGEAYLAREFKYAVDRETTEVVSGALEPNESPIHAAHRELREELGLEAKEVVDLGFIDPFTTAISCPNHLFLAIGVHASSRALDEGEVVNLTKVPFTDAVEMVMRSEITHGASCVIILKAERFLRAHPDRIPTVRSVR